MSEFSPVFNPYADYDRAVAKFCVRDSEDDPAWLQRVRRVGLRTSQRGYATGRRPTSWVGISFAASDTHALRILGCVGASPDLVTVRDNVETFLWLWKPLYYVTDLQESFRLALADCGIPWRLVASGFDFVGCRFLDPSKPFLDGPEFVPVEATFSTDLRRVVPFKKVTAVHQVNTKAMRIARKGITIKDRQPDPTPYKYKKGVMSSATVQDLLVKKFNDVMRDEPCVSRARKAFITWGSWKWNFEVYMTRVEFQGTIRPKDFEHTLGNFFDTMVEWRKRPKGKSTPYLSLFSEDNPFVRAVVNYVEASQEFQNFKGRANEDSSAARRRLMTFIRKVLDVYILQIMVNPSSPKLSIPSAYLKRLDPNYGHLMDVFESLFVKRDASYSNATVGYFCKSAVVSILVTRLLQLITQAGLIRTQDTRIKTQEGEDLERTQEGTGEDQEEEKIGEDSREDQEKTLVLILLPYLTRFLGNSDMCQVKGRAFLDAVADLEVNPPKGLSKGLDFREFTLGPWSGGIVSADLWPHFEKMPSNLVA